MGLNYHGNLIYYSLVRLYTVPDRYKFWRNQLLPWRWFL